MMSYKQILTKVVGDSLSTRKIDAPFFKISGVATLPKDKRSNGIIKHKIVYGEMNGQEKRLHLLGVMHRYKLAWEHANIVSGLANRFDIQVVGLEFPSHGVREISGEYMSHSRTIARRLHDEEVPFAIIEGYVVTDRTIILSCLVNALALTGLFALEGWSAGRGLTVMAYGATLYTALQHPDIAPLPFLIGGVFSDNFMPLLGKQRNRFFALAAKKLLETYDSALIVAGALHVNGIIERLNENLLPDGECFYDDIVLFEPSKEARSIPLSF